MKIKRILEFVYTALYICKPEFKTVMRNYADYYDCIDVFSSCMQHSKFIYLCWVFASILYLGSLLFITIISRQNIHQPIVVKELRFHYIFISRPDPGMPWEDVANVILFIPMGAFLYRFAGKYIHWYGSILTGAICSGLIEYTQYRLQCGFCDINDFMNNILGDVIGYFICLFVFTLIYKIKRLCTRN